MAWIQRQQVTCDHCERDYSFVVESDRALSELTDEEADALTNNELHNLGFQILEGAEDTLDICPNCAPQPV